MAQNNSQLGNVKPVILGGDVGAYALGLQFFEAFGVDSICVANSPVDMITLSQIFDVVGVQRRASDEELLRTLEEVALANAGSDLILMTNDDGRIGFMARYSDRLGKHYAMPIPTVDTIDLLCEKESFAELCVQEGIPTPATIAVNFEHADDPAWSAPVIDFEFPVIAKASSGEAYGKVAFPGKKKIWFVDTPQELEALWEALKDAGFRDTFLVQELIPGDDTNVRSLTFYVDSNDRVTLRAAAQVLLQDPAPTMIGNPVAMITREYPELWEMAERLLKVGGYRGFANFDIKVDPRDGTPYFFEVNPRIGRNSYYVSAAGQNPMVPMARDLLMSENVAPRVATKTALYSLVPVGLIRRYVTEAALRLVVGSNPTRGTFLGIKPALTCMFRRVGIRSFVEILYSPSILSSILGVRGFCPTTRPWRKQRQKRFSCVHRKPLAYYQRHLGPWPAGGPQGPGHRGSKLIGRCSIALATLNSGQTNRSKVGRTNGAG